VWCGAQNNISGLERGHKAISMIVLDDHDFLLMDLNFGIWQHSGRSLAIFSLRMHRNVYL